MKIAIVGGGEAVFRAAAFGLPDREDIEDSFRDLERFSSNLSDRARKILESTKGSIKSLYDDNVRRTIKQLNRSKRGIYRVDEIQFLDSQEEIATAPVSMRRWILSHPRIRSLFDRQSTHGWGAKPDAFNLNEKGTVDPYWIAIQNGVSQPNDKGEYWTEYVYGGCDVEGEKHLDLEMQMDLLATMVVIDNVLDEGIDPLNPLAEKL